MTVFVVIVFGLVLAAALILAIEYGKNKFAAKNIKYNDDRRSRVAELRKKIRKKYEKKRLDYLKSGGRSLRPDTLDPKD